MTGGACTLAVPPIDVSLTRPHYAYKLWYSPSTSMTLLSTSLSFLLHPSSYICFAGTAATVTTAGATTAATTAATVTTSAATTASATISTATTGTATTTGGGIVFSSLLLSLSIFSTHSSHIHFCTASPSGTVVDVGLGGSITDVLGNKWTISSTAVILVNGVADSTSQRVVKLVYSGGKVWYEEREGWELVIIFWYVQVVSD